jgi:hypothetical protein
LDPIYQVLQVVYWEGKVGKGKIDAFDACSADARKRDELVQRRKQFLQALPEEEKQLLQALSAERRDDSKGEVPGSERGDAEEKLFMIASSRQSATTRAWGSIGSAVIPQSGDCPDATQCTQYIQAGQCEMLGAGQEGIS